MTYLVTKIKFHLPGCRWVARAGIVSEMSLEQIPQHIWPCRNCLPQMYTARIRSHVRSSWKNWGEYLDKVLEGNPYV